MSLALQPKEFPMSDAEWQTRCDLAAIYHVTNSLGWTDTINTHMSARVPGEQNHFLINLYGETFDEVTASSLIKMDMEGNVVGKPGPFNSAGFTIHSGVYKAVPGAMCVLHTHTRAGAGVSLLDRGIRPISQDSLSVYDDLAYHKYGVPSSKEECEELGRSCAHGSHVVLHNHGLLTYGPTIHGAFHRLYRLERTCELELVSRTLGEPVVQIEHHVIAKAAERMRRIRNTPEFGLMDFQGLVRIAERKGADFRR